MWVYSYVMQQASYVEVYEWAYALASKILESEGDKRLRDLYYAIRGEETPGRFYNSLAKELGDLRFAGGLEVYGKRDLLTNTQGDSFHLVKAAVLLAFINAAGKSQTKASAGQTPVGAGEGEQEVESNNE